MKASTLSIVASFLALAAAVPLEKRILIITTVTDVVVTTIDTTTTVWVKPTNAPGQHVHNHAHKHPALAPAPAPKKAPAPVAQPQSPPEAPSSPADVNKQPAPSPAPAAPSPKQAAPVIQQAAKQAAPAPQPAPAVYTAPSPTPQPPTPAAPAPKANAYSSAKSESNSGSTADCGKVGMPCSGDITYYDTGLGACGWTNDGTREKVFALAHGMMGEQSNGNPFCGRRAEISLDGNTVVGRLVDKCGGCEGQSIDLSHALFDVLAPESKGRISDVKWHFID
ncbi:MAG: hypothetical protein L6R39_001082 [Caloplaca ligustica]|nr:MAG: hypothetical protein L6R39_001082 [Caloplaca ligustica]